MIGAVVNSRKAHDFVVVEDGGALPAAQHPDHPVPLEHGGSLPGVHHIGALGPGVGLHRPPVALFTDDVVLTRKLAVSNFEL